MEGILEMVRYVLVVDDEPGLAVATARMVSRDTGIASVGFSSSVEALAHASSHQPMLAILDVCMPTLDGFTLAVKLRQLDVKLPLVFVSASWSASSQRVAERGLAAPFRALPKPIARRSLRETISELLAK